MTLAGYCRRSWLGFVQTVGQDLVKNCTAMLAISFEHLTENPRSNLKKNKTAFPPLRENSTSRVKFIIQKLPHDDKPLHHKTSRHWRSSTNGKYARSYSLWAIECINYSICTENRLTMSRQATIGTASYSMGCQNPALEKPDWIRRNIGTTLLW